MAGLSCPQVGHHLAGQNINTHTHTQLHTSDIHQVQDEFWFLLYVPWPLVLLPSFWSLFSFLCSLAPTLPLIPGPWPLILGPNP